MNKFLFLFISLFFFEKAYSINYTYTYEETIKNRSNEYQIFLKKKIKEICITSSDRYSDIKIIYSPSFFTEKYFYKSKNKNLNFSILKQKKDLLVKGYKNGKIFKKKYKLKDPWIQQFSFGLKPFILSKEKKIYFCLISPKNFSKQDMLAKKIKKELFYIGEKKYTSQKIHISLPGFKKIFWKATCWFDIENGDLLKYEGNNGPKTPLSTTLLKTKKKGEVKTSP
ncbi:MAG: hypothetical protein AMS24_01540 [Chlamydiae bacterium SM23_39]|nr:MAG: hypothetical protein AMS24_01540 [Chlamydiae bacterium SM23_39]